MVSVIAARRIILAGSLITALLILCYQAFIFVSSGDWHWVVLADIFPSWTENLAPEDGGLQAVAHWILAELWLGIFVIVSGILGFFSASEDNGDGGDGYDV